MPNRLKEPRIVTNGTKIQIPYGTPKPLHRYFHQIVKELEDLGLANSSDSSVVLSLATQMYRRDQLTKEILTNGETFTTPDGTIRKNPASSLLNDAISSVHRLSTSLGLDPRSRLIILGQSGKDDDESDEIMNFINKVV